MIPLGWNVQEVNALVKNVSHACIHRLYISQVPSGIAFTEQNVITEIVNGEVLSANWEHHKPAGLSQNEYILLSKALIITTLGLRKKIHPYCMEED